MADQINRQADTSITEMNSGDTRLIEVTRVNSHRQCSVKIHTYHSHHKSSDIQSTRLSDVKDRVYQVYILLNSGNYTISMQSPNKSNSYPPLSMISE